MALQGPSHKRVRAYAEFDTPGPSYSAVLPIVDHEYIQYPFEFQISSEQVVASHGHSSGFEPRYDVYLEHTQKRRKVDNNVSMPQDQDDDPFLQEKLPASGSSQSEGHHAIKARWTTPMMADAQSFGYPLVKRISDFLCPCCGLCRHNGYLPIPDSQVYDPNQPYVTEEPPSMAISSLPQQLSPDQDSPQHTSFSGEPLTSPLSPQISYHILDHLSMPLAPLPLATQATVDEVGYQPIQPLTEYYSEHLMKHEPHLSSPILFPAVSHVQNDQPPVPFDPMVHQEAKYISVIDHDPRPSGVYGQYSCIPLPPHSIRDLAPLDGWSDALVHGHESNFDILLPNQRGGKRGPFRDQNLREQTAQTRRIGSCIRCRMQRIRCKHNPDDPSGGCLTCKNVANTKAGRFPCLRYKITDIRLYKPGQVPGFEWTRRWNNNISDPIQKWASPEIKVIQISEGYSSKRIELRVRKFVPQEGDKLIRTWDFNGSTKSVAIPPYALMDLEDGKLAYQKHIKDSMSETLRAVLRGSDGLLYKTYSQACQMCIDPSTSLEAMDVLSSTLRLWVSIRLSTTSEFIVGEETLGMPRDILDQTSPSPGKIPVPPVLSAQMDLILIHHIQTKLRRELLDKLQKMVLKNKQSSWLVTYIVTFILLHNASLITAHDARYARKHGMKRRFAREDKVQEYHLGANILLAHFHYCNKGIHPFSDACKDQDLRTLADLDENKIRFVRATRNYAQQHKKEWEDIRAGGESEHDFYFVSQLFEEGWQPRSISL